MSTYLSRFQNPLETVVISLKFIINLQLFYFNYLVDCFVLISFLDIFYFVDCFVYPLCSVLYRIFFFFLIDLKIFLYTSVMVIFFFLTDTVFFFFLVLKSIKTWLMKGSILKISLDWTWRLTSVIPATWEAEIGRIMVWSQPGKN
jgi:hypothetical protein